MKRYQEAIDLYKQVLEQNPNHEEARFNKAYLEQMMKNTHSSSQDESKKNNKNQANTFQFSNNSTKLKDTEWFKTNRTVPNEWKNAS